jgi:hypothetical protein
MSLLNAIPTDLAAVYFCPTCTAAYDTREEAETCARRNATNSRFKVGDILVGGTEYGWHDGLDSWVRLRKTRSQGRPFTAHEFLWVVRAVLPATDPLIDCNNGRLFNARPKEAHRSLLVVHTLGLHNGRPEGWLCWATEVYFRRVQKPSKEVRRGAAELVRRELSGRVRLM